MDGRTSLRVAPDIRKPGEKAEQDFMAFIPNDSN